MAVTCGGGSSGDLCTGADMAGKLTSRLFLLLRFSEPINDLKKYEIIKLVLKRCGYLIFPSNGQFFPYVPWPVK